MHRSIWDENPVETKLINQQTLPPFFFVRVQLTESLEQKQQLPWT